MQGESRRARKLRAEHEERQKRIVELQGPVPRKNVDQVDELELMNHIDGERGEMLAICKAEVVVSGAVVGMDVGGSSSGKAERGFLRAIKNSGKYSDSVMAQFADKMVGIFQALADRFFSMRRESAAGGASDELLAREITAKKTSIPYLIYSYAKKLGGANTGELSAEDTKTLLLSVIAENVPGKGGIGGLLYGEYLTDEDSKKRVFAFLMQVMREQGIWLVRDDNGFLSLMRVASDLLLDDRINFAVELRQEDINYKKALMEPHLRRRERLGREIAELESGIGILNKELENTHISFFAKRHALVDDISAREVALKKAKENLLQLKYRIGGVERDIVEKEGFLDRFKGSFSFSNVGELGVFLELLNIIEFELRDDPIIAQGSYIKGEVASVMEFFELEGIDVRDSGRVRARREMLGRIQVLHMMVDDMLRLKPSSLALAGDVSAADDDALDADVRPAHRV